MFEPVENEADRQRSETSVGEEQPIRLDEHLCFAIYSTAHAFNRLYKPRLDAMGVTYPQFLVLTVLWREGLQTVGSLGDRLLLDSSTLTPLLKRLEAAGLVRRERSARDERVVEVTLTDKGSGLRTMAHALSCDAAAATGQSGEELTRLRQAILRVRKALTETDLT